MWRRALRSGPRSGERHPQRSSVMAALRRPLIANIVRFQGPLLTDSRSRYQSPISLIPPPFKGLHHMLLCRALGSSSTKGITSPSSSLSKHVIRTLVGTSRSSPSSLPSITARIIDKQHQKAHFHTSATHLSRSSANFAYMGDNIVK